MMSHAIEHTVKQLFGYNTCKLIDIQTLCACNDFVPQQLIEDVCTNSVICKLESPEPLWLFDNIYQHNSQYIALQFPSLCSFSSQERLQLLFHLATGEKELKTTTTSHAKFLTRTTPKKDGIRKTPPKRINKSY